jgi:Terminase RNaseH-like domain
MIDHITMEIMKGLGGLKAFAERYEGTCQQLCRSSERVVVAIDPAMNTHQGSDETGIVVAARNNQDHFYVVADLSGRSAPHEWAEIAVAAYKRYMGDRIVAEINAGGAMVEATIRHVDPNVPIRTVTASLGKVTRAEPRNGEGPGSALEGVTFSAKPIQVRLPSPQPLLTARTSRMRRTSSIKRASKGEVLSRLHARASETGMFKSTTGKTATV